MNLFMKNVLLHMNTNNYERIRKILSPKHPITTSESFTVLEPQNLRTVPGTPMPLPRSRYGTGRGKGREFACEVGVTRK